MKNALLYFVKYPIWGNTLLVFILIVGIMSYNSTKRAFFPEPKSRNIFINVIMPGASPEEMEEGVTMKIEDALTGIVGIEEVNSISSENLSNVNILIYDKANIDEVLADVNNAVDKINSFPENAEKPIIFKQNATTKVAYLSLKGNVTPFELKSKVEEIEDELRLNDLISQVSTYGYPEIEISIEVPEAILSRYKITFEQIAQAVRLNNRDISAGSIKSADEELLIRSRSKVFTEQEIGEIILRSGVDGSMIKLKDIATIKMQFADTPNKSYLNGEISVGLTIDKLTDEDLTKISTFLKKYVREFNNSEPEMELVISFDFNDLLTARLNMLQRNGLQGLIYVLISLGLFLSIRLSFWVALGIPISFLGMFIVGPQFGLTINMLSLFGMIMVIGIMVDDGIVIAENIFDHFEKGKSPIDAAIDGTLEVFPAVFTSILTTIIAFAVLLDVEGFDAAKEIAIVGIACLAVSLLEAFFVLPAHLKSDWVLTRKKENSFSTKIRKPINLLLEFLRDKVYGRILKFAIEWRWINISIPVFLIMIVVGLIRGGFIKQSIWPTIQVDDINIEIAFKPGERETKTEDYLWKFEKSAWALNQELIEETGDTFIKYVTIIVGTTSSLGENGAHAGTVKVNIDTEGKKYDSYALINKLSEKIGKIPEAEKFSIGGVNRWGMPVSVELSGKNIAEIEGATLLLKEKLGELEVIKNIVDNSSVGKREIEIELKPQAYFLGLNHAIITNQIRQGFFGEEAQRLQIGTDEVKVWVRYPESDRVSIGKLEALNIKTQTGQEYPLNELVNYSISRGVTSIKRFNNQRQIVVNADFKDPNTPANEILEKISSSILPEIKAKYPSVKSDFGGQSRSGQKVNDSLMRNGILAGVAILIVLTLHFRSLYQVFLILPFIAVGYYSAQFGHFLRDIPFSRLSMFGFMALSGVIINDTVVFLDKFNRNIKKKMSYKEALFDAGINRFRPIMLTSITTVAGLMPLIREADFQAQFIIPMATSIAYGVLFGTLFILFFFPSFVSIANDIRRFIYWAWNGKVPDGEIVEPARQEMERLEKEGWKD